MSGGLNGSGDALRVAFDLVEIGVPVFVAYPDSGSATGYRLPQEWQRTDTTVARRALSDWRPGMALCAVMGHTLDLVDFDPRNGAPPPDFTEWPYAYATARTPSGGSHAFVAALRAGSRDGILPGVDVKGGRVDGDGRGFAFIAPTMRKSKTDGALHPYVWTKPIDPIEVMTRVEHDTSGLALAEMIRGARGANGRVNGSRPVAAWNSPSTEVDVFRPPARSFTPSEAWAFVVPHLDALARARVGTINHALNAAAKALSHFGNEFWMHDQAFGWLMSALAATEYDGRTWRAETTIDSAFRSAGDDWRAERIDPAPEGATFPDTAVLVQASAGLTLPEEFWAARPELTQIRQAAHSRGRSGDVALHAVLARLAGMWPRGVRLDSGIGSPASANYFAAVVGPSSSGKSTGVSVAKDLLAEPTWVQGGGFADGWPLGSGEGLAEAFMGWEVRPVPAVADPDTGEMVQPMGRDGHPKTERVRAQVRHNALFYMDEGEALARMLERTGATIGETLRRAWSGGTIGQANGRSETTRIIKEGSYSLGLVIGFQPETCQLLIADAAAGTPQRFLWAWAHDRALPSTRVTHPGALRDVWPLTVPTEWIIGDGFGGPAGSDVDTPVRYAESIRERLWVQTVARTHGEAAVGELDGHEPLMMVKVSALLAQLAGRREVTEDDWALAAMVWRTSCAVRDYLVAYGRSMAGKAAAASNAAHAEREGAAESARMAIRASAESAVIERIARRLANRVHEHGITARRDVQSSTAHRDRTHLDDALGHAEAMGWVKVNGADVEPGPSRPS